MAVLYSQPNAPVEVTLDGAPSGLVGTLTIAVYDTPAGTVVLAPTAAGIVEFPAGSGLYSTVIFAPSVGGTYSIVWDNAGVRARDTLVVNASVLVPVAAPTGGQTDIRMLIGRVRRAVEGVGTAAVLTDDEVKDLIADAMADIILYSGNGVFGKELVVTARGVNNEPIEYATSDALTLAEQSVVAAQAALTHFFYTFVNLKVSERISDEGQTWEYSLSATLLRDQLKYLIDNRDRALEQVAPIGLDGYESFLAVRDAYTSRLVEPWVQASIGAGGQDYRFGGV